MNTTAFDLAFDLPSTTAPNIHLIEAYPDGSLVYVTSLVVPTSGVRIPLLLSFHRGRLVHAQGYSCISPASTDVALIREDSDGSRVYHFSVQDASHRVWMRLKCIVSAQGRVEHVQELTLEDRYSEEVQFTLRMMQAQLDSYVHTGDTFYLDQFRYWSSQNASSRACLMQLLNA